MFDPLPCAGRIEPEFPDGECVALPERPSQSGYASEAAAMGGRIAECMIADQRTLRERLREVSGSVGRRRGRAGSASGVDRRAALRDAIEESIRRRSARAESVPPISYPPDLPVSERRAEIARAIAEHQVVIVCGQTGSGKSTQLPKICLEMGRGVGGMIGHTQPRRIAARSVAQRIADELGTPLGRTVGSKVRFGDRTSASTLLKVMTDGVLLAETRSDRWLERYDTLIIDEAHERSLTIDFLLGIVRDLLPRRPEFRVVIASATIDPGRFADYFASAGSGGERRPAPVIEVSGRTFPVEVRYRPPVAPSTEAPDDPDEDEPDMQASIVRAVDELCRVDTGNGPRDILIFLSGEREIRETAETLRKLHAPATPRGALGGLGGIEIIPLYSRLSAEEQARVFAPPSKPGARRIILATNVAETSLTVPGVRFVIDPGFARLSRYSSRTKVQRLPIEPISRASADQRAGRCGRLADGVCVRLYSRENYEARPAFTDPEILRSNLAGVILQMKSLGLGAVEDFPFLDHPGVRAVRDGLDTLEELGALDARGRLTAVGEELARLPIDPRIGRMVLASRREGCLEEVLIIASALSIQDPRERPYDARDEADKAQSLFRAVSPLEPDTLPHARAADSPADAPPADQEAGPRGRELESDFLVYLNLWNAYQDRARHLSSNKLRQWCRSHYLSTVRMREWRDVHRQLSECVGSLRGASRERASKNGGAGRVAGGERGGGAPSYAALHRALLAGLLSNVATLTDRYEYTGPRGVKSSIFPGSLLFQRQPRWIMAAEIVGAPKLYARTVARIAPSWIEKVGAHLVRRTYSEPYWNERMAQVWASERTTFMGLELFAHRRVHYGAVDPKAARDIFIQRALVEGDSWSDAPFVRHNRALLEQAHELQARLRRHDLMADAEVIFDFFDARIPPNIYSGSAFEQWLKAAQRDDPRSLFMARADLFPGEPGIPPADDFPDTLDGPGAGLALEYRFTPGEPDDGVTLVIPIERLAVVSEDRGRWLVPGLLREKVIALMRTLPKPLRRLLVPVPEFAWRALADPDMNPPYARVPRLSEALALALSRCAGERIDPALFKEEEIPEHLRMNFRVVEGQGAETRILAEGRDLAAIRVALRARVEAGAGGGAAVEPSPWHRDGVLSWDFGDLPAETPLRRDSITIRGYPAIVDPRDYGSEAPRRPDRAGASRGGEEGVSLRALDSAERAERLTMRGLRRLAYLHTRDEVRFLIHHAPGYERLALQYGVLDSVHGLEEGLGLLIAERAFLSQIGPIRTRQAFDIRLESAWHTLGVVVSWAVGLGGQILEAHQALRLRLESNARGPGSKVGAAAKVEADIQAHIGWLLSPGFLARTPPEWLAHFPRYLRADQMRLEKLPARGPARDEALAAQVRAVIADWQVRVEHRREQGIALGDEPELQQFRWLIEEWRVSLFAQELGSAQPISLQRLQKRWAALPS